MAALPAASLARPAAPPTPMVSSSIKGLPLARGGARAPLLARPQAPRPTRRCSVGVSASYVTSGYGPVGGDARIKVIGCGGGGGNAVNRMIQSGLQVRA